MRLRYLIVPHILIAAWPHLLYEQSVHVNVALQVPFIFSARRKDNEVTYIFQFV